MWGFPIVLQSVSYKNVGEFRVLKGWLQIFAKYKKSQHQK